MEIRIEAELDGERLDVALAEALGTRSRAARLIEQGRVTVDGRDDVTKRTKVAAGQTVVVAEDEPEPPRDLAAGVDFAVPFEDEHLLVVDKPAGLVVHPGAGNRTGTLAQALAGVAAGGEEEWRAGIVHRLDRDTSGLLVVAKSERTHAALKDAIQARLVTREYLALAEGRPPARAGTIDAPIGRDRTVRTRVSTDTNEPRDAITHFVIEEALPRHTLLRVTLDTGRTHQIRVHLRAIGHPVAGDPEYGTAGELGLGRQFLHATRLAFTHPATGAPIDLVSPLPADLEQALAAARTAT